MNYRLSLTPAAEADIAAAALYIARNSLSAGIRFYDAIDKTLQQIRDHPRRWPRYELDEPRLAELRKRAVSGFQNYLVFYTVGQDSILVLRVLHGARDLPSILGIDS
jgi:toxin ParE1/3/4